MATTLNVIKTLTIRGTTEGVAQVERQLANLTSGIEDVTVASAKQEKVTLSVETAYKRLQTQYDQQFRSQQQMAQAQRTLTQAQEQGLASQERAAELAGLVANRLGTVQNVAGQVTASFSRMNSQLGITQNNVQTTITGFGTLGTTFGTLQNGSATVTARLASFNNTLTVTQNGVTTVAATLGTIGNQFGALNARVSNVTPGFSAANMQLGQFGNQSKAARYELINLSRQIQDVGVSLASGQNPFTVLIQQGSQIADVFASSQLTMAQWAQRFLTFFTPARLLILGFTAAVGALALAWIKLRDTGPDVEATFKAQASTLDVLQKAYKDNTKAAGEFLAQSEAITRSQVLQQLIDFQRIISQTTTALTKATTTPTSVPSEIPIPFGVEAIENATKASSAFRELNVIIDRFNESAKRATDVQAYREALAGIFNSAVQTNPQLAEAAKQLLDNSEAAGKAALGYQMAEAALAVLNGTATEAQRKLLGLAAALKSDAWDQFIQKTREAIEITRLEGQEVGKSQAEVRKMRIEFEAQRAAKQAGREVDRGAIEALKNEAAAAEDFKKASQDAFQAGEKVQKLMQDLSRERETVFFTKEDQQIAERLKDLYPNVTDAINSTEAAQIRLTNALLRSQEAAGDFINTFITGLLRGESLVNSLAKAIQNLGAQITQAASKQLGTQIVEGISGSFGKVLGGALGGSLGTFGGPLGALAVGAGVSLLGSFLGGDKQKEQEAQQNLQQIQQQADASSQSLAGLVDQMRALNDVSEGLAGTIGNARKQMEDVFKAAQKQIAFAIQQGTAGLLSTAAATALVAQANQAMADAQREFEEFQRRSIENARAALRGEDNLSAVQQRIKDLNEQAAELEKALIDAGHSAEEAARLIEEDLIVALKRLAETIERDMRRAINEMKGEGFKNAAEDLKQQISDAMAAGVDPAVIEEFTRLSLQKIVNDFKLTGRAFIELMAQFPQFIGQITEFSDKVKRSADELERAARSLEDRLFAATTDTNTLAGALAAFDRNAAREIKEEREAGGENLLLLERTLAAERLNIIEEFNERAIQAEEERMRQLNALALDIATYVNQLFAGPESSLSPLARLQQAQSAFNAQLALAQGGNEQALSTITRFAEDLRLAGQAYFGSSTGYQSLLGQIATALINLPPVQETTDPVVQALVDTVTPAIQATTAAVGGTTTAVGGTTSAVNTNTSATTSQTTTQSNENAQQLAQQQAIVGLISATNNLNTTANTLQTTSNNLITSTNNLLATVTSLLNTSNSTLAAIQSLQNTANSTLSAVETNTNAINAASSSQIPILQQIQANTAQTNVLLSAPHPWQSGGLVTGGIPGRDSVKSILTPGEVVIREPVARNNPWLVGFNQSGQMPRMTVGAANDNIERLLSLIAQKLDINISAIVGQTVAVTREARFAARKGNAA